MITTQQNAEKPTGKIAPSTIAEWQVGNELRHGMSPLYVSYFSFFFILFSCSDLLCWSEISVSLCRRWTPSCGGRVVAMIDTVVVVLIVILFFSHLFYFIYSFFCFYFCFCFVFVSYIALGEKYAEVYNEVVIKKNIDWQPLQPINVCVDLF
jgi:fatty acid desaturase